MEISETLTTHHSPTFSPYRSPALASALQEKVKDLKMRIAGFGLKPKELLGMADPDTLRLKTGQLSLFEDYTEYLDSLPASGIMRNGLLYRALNLVCRTTESGFIVLPTPMKSDAKGESKTRFFASSKHRGFLRSFIRDGESDGIYPNPELTEVLMTFPAGYTDLSVLEMPLYH